MDISQDVVLIRQEILNLVDDLRSPTAIYKPALKKVGGVWYANYHDFFATGETPGRAMDNFNKKWYEKSKG